MKRMIIFLLILTGIALGQSSVKIMGKVSDGNVQFRTDSLGNLFMSSESLAFMRYTTPDSLYEAGTDTLTTSWVDMGAEIDMRGYTQLNIYVTLDINGCQNAQIRALGKYESAGSDEYPFMIETVSSTDIKVDPEYIEFNDDVDQKAILKIQVEGVPYIQLQMKVGVVGDGAQYDKVYINKIWR